MYSFLIIFFVALSSTALLTLHSAIEKDHTIWPTTRLSKNPQASPSSSLPTIIWPSNPEPYIPDDSRPDPVPLIGVDWTHCADSGFVCHCQGLVRMNASASGVTGGIPITTSVDCTAPGLRARLWPSLRTRGFCEFRHAPLLRLQLGPYCLNVPSLASGAVNVSINGWPGPGLTAACESRESLWAYHKTSGQVRHHGRCLTAVSPTTNVTWEPMVVTLAACNATVAHWQRWLLPDLSAPNEALASTANDVRLGVGRVLLESAAFGTRCLRISKALTPPVTEPALFLEAALCADVKESGTAEVLWLINAPYPKEANEAASGWTACDDGDCSGCGDDCEMRGVSGDARTSIVSPPGQLAERGICDVEKLRRWAFPEDVVGGCQCQPSGAVKEVWERLAKAVGITRSSLDKFNK